MVNKEHYALLNKGVTTWNKWRDRNPDVVPDLSGTNLSGTDLTGTDLTGTDLTEVDLSYANLSGTNFRKAELSNSNLSYANLIKADLWEVDLREVDLSNANLSYANLREADLREVDLSNANLSYANLMYANLSNANLSGAILRLARLIEANLSEANLGGRAILIWAELSNANLSNVNLSNAILSRAILTEANLSNANLSNANLIKAHLDNANLTEANLSNANLSNANLTEANLRAADLSGTDFRRAKLCRTQALKTNFSNAKFTSACLEDWHINSATKLDNIDCHYVYLKSDKQERRPSSGEFAPGEFTKLFQKALETVDLIFTDGIDWKAFLLSFQELQAKYGEENLSVQAIEKKSGGVFVIRLEVPPEANKADIERQAKVLYEQKLILLETKYHTELKAKDEQIEIYRNKSADLLEITKLMANRPIQNIIDVTATAESKSMSEGSKQQFNNNLQGAQFAGGLVNADKVEAGQIGGNINNYTPQQKQNLAEAAAEIQQLLQQLEQTNPTTSTSEKMTVVAKAVDEIEKNPTLKARIIGALKSGGTEALKEAIDHPLVNILMASIEGWQEAE